MKNLGAKILKIMATVKSIQKEGFNAFHKYKYATDASIVTKLRKEMIVNGLICYPNHKGCTREGELTILTVEYTLMDIASGESLVTTEYGYGHDKGDKGLYKAATGAEKYYLLKTFMIPTDDDPENEKEKPPYQPKRSAAVPEEGNPYITNPEAITLFKLLGGDKAKQAKFREWLANQGIEGTNKIKKEGDYNKAYEFIIKLNDEGVGA